MTTGIRARYFIIMLSWLPVSVFAITAGQKEAADAFLSAMIDNKATPGLQYLFVDVDRILFSFQGGYADLQKKIPVNEHTTFNAYSITKTFTAAAIIKLVQEGKIDLDAPISRYLHDFPYRESPSVRQTLMHTGGFPNPNPMAWIHKADEHAQFDDQSFIRQVIHKHNTLKSKPGEKYSYSNIGYLLLGEAIHQVSGKPYTEYVAKEIIAPLSLSQGDRIAYTIDDPDSHARGYIRRWYWLNLALGWFIDRDEFLGPAVDGWVPFTHMLVNGTAYGGLVGNAGGFAAYLQAMLAARPPFNREMLDMLSTPGSTSDGKLINTGLAWHLGTLDDQRYMAHSGGAGGYYCEIRIYPDANRASVIMTNNTGISNQRYLDRIDHLFLTGANDHESSH